MKPRIPILVASVAIVLSAAPADAGLVFRYDGPLFDQFFPSAGGLDFTSADRITGTFVFEDATATQAQSIRLSTTVAGNPGFEFDIPDVSAPGAFNVVTNDFTFAGDDIVAWDLTIDGEVFGDADGFETLSISSVAGDLATIDFLGVDQSDAFTFSTGQFTAVPEPSGFILCATACGFAMARRRRKKQMRSYVD